MLNNKRQWVSSWKKKFIITNLCYFNGYPRIKVENPLDKPWCPVGKWRLRLVDAPPMSWLTEVYCKPQSNGFSMILFGSTMDWFKRHFDIKPWFVVNHEGVLYICRPILAWWGYYGPKTHQTYWRQNIWNNWLKTKGLAYESQAMTSLKGKSWGKASEKHGWTPPSSSIIAIVEMALSKEV